MAELFGIDKSGISRHLKRIFESNELDEKVVVAKFATTSPHGAMPDKFQQKPDMKTISVNLVMTYPVHWTRYQVLRDFAQNFYDAIGFDNWRQNFHYEYMNERLSMWVKNVSFNYEWLMHIGASTKTNQSNGYAGFFGEGFKIASLCAFRDYNWKIQMMSDNWHIDVTEIEKSIDHTPVRMLAYDISSIEKMNETKLLLQHISKDDFDLFQIVLDSFFCPDNPIMGKELWQGKVGAVFLRSKMPINSRLPVTRDFGRKGAVFCRYQIMGTNPFDLVVCLHKYRKEDRERNSLYSFDVIDVFEEIAYYVDSECAMVMLEKMRKYWNTYPQKAIDIHSWSNTVDALIKKVASSTKIRNAFVNKYDNILCLKKIYSIGDKNRRWQARAWLDQQEKKYILAKDTFRILGYPLLEEKCAEYGGFVTDDNADNLQKRCFMVLEDVCMKVFQGFFAMDSMPERKIITNSHAAYHGMAVTYKKSQPLLNVMGIRIRYDIGKLYLKSEIFRPEGYYDGLSTYVHEMCHIFGGDASVSFSQALTFATELLMENQEKVIKGKYQWKQIFENNNDAFDAP